jgi:hypothetical protein
MACPATGGPEWIEATSTHFTLRTDLAADDATRLVQDAEEILVRFTDVIDFFLPPATGMGRTSLVVLRTLPEYQALVVPWQQGHSGGTVGNFISKDERGRATIALSTALDSSEIFRHELAHRLLHQRVGDAPQWLDEGFAEYFSTLPVNNGKIALGQATTRMQQFNRDAGAATAQTLRDFRSNPTKALDWILNHDKEGQYIEGAYLVVWAMVHYLANGSPENARKFRTFLLAISAGKPWKDVLTEQYGALPVLEGNVAKHLAAMHDDTALQWYIPYTPPPAQSWTVNVRKLDDGEVHHLRAALLPPSSARELALATNHAPQSAEVHRWLANEAAARHDDGVAAVEMERATDLNSDPFYRFEQARIAFEHELRNPIEQQRHLETMNDQMRLVARYATQPEELALIAHYYELVHELDFGATFASRAIAMDPGCATCLATWAGLQFARGELQTAVTALEKAVRHWPGKKIPDEMLARLTRYRCAAARQQGARCEP